MTQEEKRRVASDVVSRLKLVGFNEYEITFILKEALDINEEEQDDE